MPKVKNLPPNVRGCLLNTTYAGSQRAPLAVRRLLAHLVKLRLITASTGATVQKAGPFGSAANPVALSKLTYRVCRHVTLHAMTRSVLDESPAKVGFFDFAF